MKGKFHFSQFLNHNSTLYGIPGWPFSLRILKMLFRDFWPSLFLMQRSQLVSIVIPLKAICFSSLAAVWTDFNILVPPSFTMMCRDTGGVVFFSSWWRLTVLFKFDHSCFPSPSDLCYILCGFLRHILYWSWSLFSCIQATIYPFEFLITLAMFFIARNSIVLSQIYSFTYL